MSLCCTPRHVAMNSISVMVRKRPKIISRESDENDVVRCEASSTVVVYEPRTKLDLTPVIEPSMFSFDHVFDETATNADVYETCCHPLLQDVKAGASAIVFAFGQTGSGKTHTMLGRGGECRGLYSFTVAELLVSGAPCSLIVSFYEVYGTKLFDLFNGRTEVKMLQDESHNIHIVGLSERVVSGEEELRQLMSKGELLRASGTTQANDRSSRSHAVLNIRVQFENGDHPCGRITFVDLAGSERAADTADTDAKVRREGAEINKSLLALKECIRAMSLRKRHIPFRASKLTQILRESFVGRSKTCMIANISPCQRHCEDTLNTLRYAYRIKELKSPVNDVGERELPTPCLNCGLPIFAGDKHVCLRLNVQCPHCRQEMDKPEMDLHLTECKEFPTRCPHCNEHMLRGGLARHNRRCIRFPVRCPLCSCQVIRSNLEKHMLVDCKVAKEKCHHCGLLFQRHLLASHELQCEMMKIVCSFCSRYIRRGRMECHLIRCPKGLNRKTLPSPKGIGSNPSPVPSTVERDPLSPHQDTQLGRHLSVESAKQKKKTGNYLSEAACPSPVPSFTMLQDGADCVCPYARYGCAHRMLESELPVHLVKAVAVHLQMVSVYADRMDAENAALRRLVVREKTEQLEFW